MKKLLSLLLCMLLLLPICGCDALEGILNEWEDSQKSLQVDSDFSVHFIDVGQGDCILIRSGEHSMLIDAGENSA